jgi:hypothetical protein
MVTKTRLQIQCMDCAYWCGRCLKGKIQKLASDTACDKTINKNKTSGEN